MVLVEEGRRFYATRIWNCEYFWFSSALKAPTPVCSQFAVRQGCLTFSEDRQWFMESASTDEPIRQCTLILAAYGENPPYRRAIAS